MISRKFRILKMAAGAVLSISMLLQTSKARGGDTVELAFTKWTLPGGVIGGRLDNAAGTFAGAVISIAPPEREPPASPIAQIVARYDITFDGNSFSASIEGHQNNSAQTGVLNGTITNGWQAGANVHVEYDVVDQGTARDLCPRRFCFVGTIRIMPNVE
jgi:hypothetical protein